MDILYETNGKGYLGWIIDYPGSYIRGITQENAHSKIDNELIEYGKWLGITVTNDKIYHEVVRNSNLMIEDADSDVIFESEKEDYKDESIFEADCSLVLMSANKLFSIYSSCKNIDMIDKTMIKKTFYGNAYCSIETQYRHVVDVQQYYLSQIGCRADIKVGIIRGRINTIDAIKTKYKIDRNKIYRNGEEEWSIKKILRRLIWHDRIHGKAIERMNKRLLEI